MLVTFIGIPEGVSVMVPDEVLLAPDKGGTSANEMAGIVPPCIDERLEGIPA